MTKISKRIKALSEKVESEKLYALDDAIKLLKETATAKFDESVDVAVNLGINARKSDQNVRGSVAMPHGTGKTVRVAVFAEGELAEAARAAGADIVGLEDLAEIVLKGEVEFDVAIATPETMRVVGRLGQVLGPKGLMPNPKVGTVTPDVAKAVQAAKAGQVQFRIDKAGIIHAAVGKVSFTEQAIKENLLALLDGLKKAKPAAAKGTYLKRVALSSTMGPSIKVERSSVDV